jgi:hypothetical protein
MPLADRQLGRVAARLGVSRELFVEVRQGKFEPLRLRRGIDVSREVKFCVRLPPALRREWREQSENRQVPVSTLLRSLLHLFLTDRHRPAHLGKVSVLRGRAYHGKRGDPYETTWIPPGASRALEVRARELHSSPSAIARGMIVELLEARVRSLPLVGLDSMWDDEARYLAERRS